jgi:hypothetical protein
MASRISPPQRLALNVFAGAWAVVLIYIVVADLL